MSCQNVAMILTEMARGQMLDARVKAEALAHMETCERCTARLADEQTLTSGLRAVAPSIPSTEIPGRIEAALLVAFRQRATTPFGSQSSAPPKSKSTHRLPWSIAAAAAILIVSALAIPRLLSTSPPERAGDRANEAQSVSSLSPEDDSEIQATNGVENVEEAIADVQPPPNPGRRGVMRPVGLNNKSGLNKPVSPTNTPAEIATDFLPLTYGGNLSQFDDGQIVRVELPRSALQSFGLPMNAERGSERVKADVLLGHDGVAHAIRFVR